MARVMQHDEEERVIEDPGERVHVWPHLVSIELVGALIYLLALSLMSILIRAPLVDLANPEVTPNPAKAPWYFLGLQELLLHMHPALAGVIVPGAVLTLLAAIPYIDRSRAGTGIWFSTPKGFRSPSFPPSTPLCGSWASSFWTSFCPRVKARTASAPSSSSTASRRRWATFLCPLSS